jgi:hypothetical protein
MAIEHLGGGSYMPGRRLKPLKKEIDHIRLHEGENGGHILEHHHTEPMHHPMERHVFAKGDHVGMAKHLNKHAHTTFPASEGVHQKGTQNPEDSDLAAKADEEYDEE